VCYNRNKGKCLKMSNGTDTFVMDRFINEAMVIISDKISLSKRKKRSFRRSLKSTLGNDVDTNVIPSLGRSIMVALFEDGVDDSDVDSIIESTKDICKQFVIENIRAILIGVAEHADGHDNETRRSLEISVHDIYKTIESRVSKLLFDDPDEVAEKLIDIFAVFSELKDFDMNMIEECIGIYLANALKGDIEEECESDSGWETSEDEDMPLVDSDDDDICTIGEDNLFERRCYEEHKTRNVMVEMEKYNDKLQKLSEEFEELKGELKSYIKRDEEASTTLFIIGWAFIISHQFGNFFTNSDTYSPRGLEMHPF